LIEPATVGLPGRQNCLGGAKLKVDLTSRPTDPNFRFSAIPTRSARPTDSPRAARRRKIWVGTPDRPPTWRSAKPPVPRVRACFSWRRLDWWSTTVTPAPDSSRCRLHRQRASLWSSTHLPQVRSHPSRLSLPSPTPTHSACHTCGAPAHMHISMLRAR